LQKKFRALGIAFNYAAYETEVFSALWACNQDEAKRVLAEFQRFGFPIYLREDGLWHIPKSVLSVAEECLAGYPEEARQASRRFQKWQKKKIKEFDKRLTLQLVHWAEVTKHLIRQNAKLKEHWKNDNLSHRPLLLGTGDFSRNHSYLYTPTEEAKAISLSNRNEKAQAHFEQAIYLTPVYLLLVLIFIAIYGSEISKVWQVIVFFYLPFVNVVIYFFKVVSLCVLSWVEHSHFFISFARFRRFAS
jgi:hypothetical protein